MDSTKTTDFSAKEPSLGYYYQIRYSLYLLIKSREKDCDIEISIENLDDISLENANAINLFQTKCHIKSVANLTNSSSDLWRTIRVWSNHIANDRVNPEKTIFTLITTAKAPDNSVSKMLSDNSDTRDNGTILETLEEVANKSQNKENKKYYDEFKSLTQIQKEALIRNIRVLDSSLNIESVKQVTLNELKLCTTPEHLNSFYERLEGWWFNKCIMHLLREEDSISFKELQFKIDEIREQFTKDSLPIDDIEGILVDELELESDNRIFVQQLRLIEVGKETLRNSISDYYKAFEQRSRWLRDGLLNPNEEEKYELRLHDDWNSKFCMMVDELNSEDDTYLISEGKIFYRRNYIDNLPNIHIREKVREGFITRGSYHMLSNKKIVGWHPKFRSLLKGEE